MNCPNCGMPFVPPPHGRPFSEWECGSRKGHEKRWDKTSEACRKIREQNEEIRRLQNLLMAFTRGVK